MPKFTDFKMTDTDYDGQDITVNEIEIEDNDILEYARKSYTPDDIFHEDKEELHDWATTNGYTKENSE